MTELLAIANAAEDDELLVEEVARRHPDTVTVLLNEEDDGGRWGWADGPRERALRDRLALLLARVERATDASVLGVVGDVWMLTGRSYDGIVGAFGLTRLSAAR
jgi:hypothetical protein